MEGGLQDPAMHETTLNRRKSHVAATAHAIVRRAQTNHWVAGGRTEKEEEPTVTWKHALFMRPAAF